MRKQVTFYRLLTYMWRYKWISILALVFIFATTLVTTTLPLLARYFIDHFISRYQRFLCSDYVLCSFSFASVIYFLGTIFFCACGT